jgi:predicted membrane protein
VIVVGYRKCVLNKWDDVLIAQQFLEDSEKCFMSDFEIHHFKCAVVHRSLKAGVTVIPVV